MTPFRFLLDRTAVLFLGVLAGCLIGYAFGTGNESRQAVMLAPEAAPVQGAAADVAPPPPTAPAAVDTAVKDKATPADGPAEPAVTAVEEAASNIAGVVPPPAAPPPPPAALGHTIRIGVFGDSFGDGVHSGLYRLLPASQGYHVEKYSQPSTGFTRYRRLNLETHDEGRIGAERLDVAVIAFGANDAQGVCGDDGKCGALMSTRWQAVIGDRVERYVAMLRRHGASVYWVGLPAMRDRGFDGDSVAMNAFYRTLMARLGVPFVDIRPLTVDAGGQYEAYYPDEKGAPRLLRANDGIHMSMNGYVRITKGLAARIRDAAGAARAPEDVTP